MRANIAGTVDLADAAGLRQDDWRIHSLLDNVELAAIMLDADGNLTYCNANFLRITGWRRDDALGRNWFETFLPPERAVEARARFDEHIVNHALAWGDEAEILTRSGDRRLIHWSNTALRKSAAGASGIASIGEDVTERKSAEDRLRLFRTLMDQIPDGVDIVDPETLRFLDVNENQCRQLGYSREEMLSMRVSDLDPSVSAERVLEVERKLHDGAVVVLESLHRRKDGSTFPVEVSIRNVNVDREYSLMVVRDITERKRAEKALGDSEARYRSLTEDTSDAVAVIEPEGRISYISPAIRAIVGFAPEELTGRCLFDFVHPRDAAKAAASLAELIAQPDRPHRSMEQYRHKDGSWRSIEAVSRNLLGRPPVNGIVVTIRDVTERERYVRALGAISATNAALVHAADERELLQESCRALVETGGYAQVWIGFGQHDSGKSVLPAASAGAGDGGLAGACASWDAAAAGQAPFALALRTGQPAVARKLMAGPGAEPWRADAVARGYAAIASIPLERVFGALTVLSEDGNAFDCEEVELLQQLGADLAFGIRTMRERQTHTYDLERLERSMEATVHAIAGTIEKRDPYTAGHQRKVALLCTAIGQELGLEKDRLHGLELAATVHDVGKIDIPAEILAKPGRLSGIEYSLVQGHAQAGYEILKDVEFPWPIAEMVWQHHEKMDGSGYPRGLKSEQIMLEARILVVADVIDAMSSHRPYRPGLGLEVALAEVIRGRGLEYDADVVDACVKVIRERGFTFESAHRQPET